MSEYDTKRDQLIEGDIERALDTLFGDMPAATMSRVRVERVLRDVATHVSTNTANMLLLSLRTVHDVAYHYNVSPRRVRAIARARKVGWQVPGSDTWLFLPSDVPLLKPNQPGYPKGRSRK